MPLRDSAGARLRRDWPLVLLTIAAAALVLFKVRVAVLVGPGWDTYAFLANAAEFAGKGYGYTELHRPPLLSLITALAFRAGAPLDVWVIQWIDGALSLSGIVAAYLLASRRMGRPFAAIAALSLLAVQPLWSYLGSGYTDFPSVALSMWMLLACIKATEDDPRYYAAAAVLFVAAVMMRYTALLAAFPAGVWMAFRWQPFRQVRALGMAALAALTAYLPAGIYYTARFNDALFPFILAFGISEEVSAPGGEGAQVTSAAWYVSSLLKFLGPGSLWVLTALALTVAALGLILASGAHARLRRPTIRDLGFAILGIAPAVVAQVAGAGMVVRQLTIPVAVFALWRFAGLREPTGRSSSAGALDAAMLTWLLAYLDFHGHQSIQVPRYFITMAVPLLYFAALGWYRFAGDILRTVSVRGSDPEPRAAAIVRTVTGAGFAAVAVVALVVTARATPVTPDIYVTAGRESGAWFREHGVGAADVVYSDLWPLTAWYARIPARPMPFFKDARAFQHELDRSSADYYLTYPWRHYAGFTRVARADWVAVLARSSEASATLPRVLYLGKAWDNYLESVTGFRFYLDSDAGRYGWEGTAFADSMTASQLATHKVVAMYGFKWRNRAAGEAALRRYVEGGGTVVLDASANLGELPYDLANTVVFDTVVRRRPVPEDAVIRIAASYAGGHPELARVSTSRFLDQNGKQWYGADYEPLPGTSAGTVLATIDGRPLVMMKRFGKGRVYFIGYNLVWHAFTTGSATESSIIRAVFDDALAPASPRSEPQLAP